MDFKGKSVLVTAAAQGIGRAAALRFLEEGLASSLPTLGVSPPPAGQPELPAFLPLTQVLLSLLARELDGCGFECHSLAGLLRN